ncbi:MAG: hypothetical protein WC264_03325 [Candidatus Paceibacterota bacterium]|jgi:hypothetical protein
MKIKFFKIKNNFAKEGRFQEKPDFFWKIALYLGFILAIIFFILGFFIFKQVDKELILSEEDNSGKSKVIQKERVKEALEYFKEQEKKSEEILNYSFTIIDPSL